MRYAKESSNAETKERKKADQDILDFEKRLSEPMLPDTERAMKKVEKKFPMIINTLLGASVGVLAILYGAIGFTGVLTFILGMLSVVALIAIVIFRYIVNENERARAKRESLKLEEAEKLEEFVIVDDHAELKKEINNTERNNIDESSSKLGHNLAK